MTHIGSPRFTLHPRDATLRGLEDGGLARIHSRDGTTVLRVTIDTAMRPGNAFVPMHWTDQFSSSGPIGRLVHALTDPVSGQPDLKGTKVQVSALAESWRGLLLRHGNASEPVLGNSVHWTKTPIATGHSFELSGWSPLAALIDSEQALRALLELPQHAELIAYSDPRRSVFRYAGLVDGRLNACAYFAPPRIAFPEADNVARLLGQVLEPMTRLSLLAGVQAGTARTGKIVCSCFSVGKDAICSVIRAKNLSTPAEIGAALRAGTSCGSCIPELKKLLAAQTANLSTMA
jgi:assimilatory nitrate reductase catalytic subunit